MGFATHAVHLARPSNAVNDAVGAHLVKCGLACSSCFARRGYGAVHIQGPL